jgi:hypothetical protein
MGIVRFALRFPYTFYVLAALIVFLGSWAIVVMPNAAVVFVRDVGEARDAWAVQQNVVREGSQRTILLSIIKNGDAWPTQPTVSQPVAARC